MHRVEGLPGESGPVGLTLALGRLRALGVTGLRVSLPQPGHPLGLTSAPFLNGGVERQLADSSRAHSALALERSCMTSTVASGFDSRIEEWSISCPEPLTAQVGLAVPAC